MTPLEKLKQYLSHRWYCQMHLSNPYTGADGKCNCSLNEVVAEFEGELAAQQDKIEQLTNAYDQGFGDATVKNTQLAIRDKVVLTKEQAEVVKISCLSEYAKYHCEELTDVVTEIDRQLKEKI